MAFITAKSKITNTILNFVKHLVSKSVYNDIKVLLTPCCIPTVVFDTVSCGNSPYNPAPDLGGVYGVIFSNVTITDVSLANKSVTVLLTSVNYINAGAFKEITFDSSGVWNGTIYSSFDNAPSTLDIIVTILEPGQKVIQQTKSVTVTGVPNCD